MCFTRFPSFDYIPCRFLQQERHPSIAKQEPPFLHVSAAGAFLLSGLPLTILHGCPKGKTPILFSNSIKEFIRVYTNRMIL